MDTVGLPELQHDASDLVRRVEAGEEIEITVYGRPAARLVPAQTKRWVRWEEVADLFTGPTEDTWGWERGLIDESVVDPWDGRA